MAEPGRHLKPVDDDADPLIIVNGRTGEQLGPLADEVQGLHDEIRGLHRDVKAEHRRYENLKRDKNREAREHQLWPLAVKLWRYYCRLTGSRAKFSGERFFLVLPFLEDEGAELCQRAIDGRVAEHFSTTRRNGTTKHYWEWERIFGSMGQGKTARDNFEESANRAPLPYEPAPLEGD